MTLGILIRKKEGLVQLNVVPFIDSVSPKLALLPAARDREDYFFNNDIKLTIIENGYSRFVFFSRVGSTASITLWILV